MAPSHLLLKHSKTNHPFFICIVEVSFSLRSPFITQKLPQTAGFCDFQGTAAARAKWRSPARAPHSDRPKQPKKQEQRDLKMDSKVGLLSIQPCQTCEEVEFIPNTTRSVLSDMFHDKTWESLDFGKSWVSLLPTENNQPIAGNITCPSFRLSSFRLVCWGLPTPHRPSTASNAPSLQPSPSPDFRKSKRSSKILPRITGTETLDFPERVPPTETKCLEKKEKSWKTLRSWLIDMVPGSMRKGKSSLVPCSDLCLSHPFQTSPKKKTNSSGCWKSPRQLQSLANSRPLTRTAGSLMECSFRSDRPVGRSTVDVRRLGSKPRGFWNDKGS